jgi:hypothetical protein
MVVDLRKLGSVLRRVSRELRGVGIDRRLEDLESVFSVQELNIVR